ncbi:Adp-glucose pyrophosphorylase family protein [Thalictrum thalictroides]|uniref:Adp-glucose pyrophosphorylase family protein n=1 Tax=Thalictrum thalictroides TaxID=46969 RepID=A0A7J6WAG1_THATH|nr:Adp-glucose pyrophosphorylase family protein [Thalictrum thalictroides]
MLAIAAEHGHFIRLKRDAEWETYNKGFGDLGLNLFEMDSSEENVVVVIMVGGPTKGTRFRPLSLNVPKPLFPLAG